MCNRESRKAFYMSDICKLSEANIEIYAMHSSFWNWKGFHLVYIQSKSVVTQVKIKSSQLLSKITC